MDYCKQPVNKTQTWFHASTQKLVSTPAWSPDISQLLLLHFQASPPQTDGLHSRDTEPPHNPPSVVFWCPVPESLLTNMPAHVVSITVTDTNRLLTDCHMLGRNWLANTNIFAHNLRNQQQNSSLVRFTSWYIMHTLRILPQNIKWETQQTVVSLRSATKIKKTDLLKIGGNINRGCFVDIFFHVVRSYDRLGLLDCKDCLSPVSHRWIPIIWPQSRKQKAPRYSALNDSLSGLIISN